MHLVFSDQPLPSSQTKSVFLAGPSPRRADEADWRPEALALLRALGFDGTVFIPIPRNRFSDASVHTREDASFENDPSWSYDNQVYWECRARAMADLIVFWVPRVIDHTKADLGMPALTTNFEMGEDLASGKVLYGRPAHAVKCSYLDQRARSHGLQVHSTLTSLLAQAVDILGDGATRQGGEAQVPLRIWRSPMFQSWYANLKAAGNRLDGAVLLNQVTVGGAFLFSFALMVNVWVESEQRNKTNEFFVTRPDTSAVVAMHRSVGDDGAPKVELALVREFRSTVNNAWGMVFELPAGSSFKPGLTAQMNAREELSEETGLHIEDASRFREVATRQLAATFSTHRAHVFAVELTAEEFAQLRKSAASGMPLGDPDYLADPSGERTYVEIATMTDVFNLPVDFATLGMVVESLRTLGALDF